MEVSDQLHAEAALPQGKSPWYPLDRSLGGPQSRSVSGGGEKNSQLTPEIETRPSDGPARSQPIYRLSYPGLYRQKLVIFSSGPLPIERQ
jgi:hypothetical protein